MERKMSSKKKIGLVVCAVLLCLLIAGGVAGYFLLKKDDTKTYEQFYNEFSTLSKVGQSSKYLGEVQRNLPQTGNEGLERYPKYGVTLTKKDGQSDEDFTIEKQAILDENQYLLAGDTYDSLDEDGYLYKNEQSVLDGEGNHRKLYKHTASQNLYYGDVSDEEKAVVKSLTISPRATSGNYITGLYAPAGEVVKIEISEENLENMGAVTVLIGQALANGQANDIWMARDFNRMPVILNKFTISKPTTFVGSHFGGPIYISTTTMSSFDVKISGAVRYSHFILGQTSKQEFEANKQSSAPYFDLEVWDDGVRFSGPKRSVDDYSYDELYRTANLWEKIAGVSNQVPQSGNSNLGITFLFDPFVAAGAAVAFPGRNSVNCPESWMSGCFDYDNFVENGAWGNIHEYNHHYQRYGFAPGDEVTNNAVSLVAYSLYTNISSKRSLDDSTLSGWNRFTDASRSLRETISLSQNDSVISSLSSYADVLHAFGQTAFLNAASLCKGSGGVDLWFKSLSDACGSDFTYYFESVLHQSISSEAKQEIADKNYPMFVPIASIYQTGRKLEVGENFVNIKTMQPFQTAQISYEFDLLQSIIVPRGFSVEIKSVSAPAYGSLTKQGDVYTYTFDDNCDISSDIVATIKITKDDNAFVVEDYNLVLGFKKKEMHEVTKTTYTFAQGTLPTNLNEVVENGITGFINEQTQVQSTTQVLAPAINTISKIQGKIYISSTGKYRFVLGARMQAVLKLSINSQALDSKIIIDNQNINTFIKAVELGYYKDFDLKRGDYVYFECYCLADVSNSYINIGMGKVQNQTANIVTVGSSVLYAVDKKKEQFETHNIYPKEYCLSELGLDQPELEIVETNFQEWDSTTKLENMIDGDLSTYMHTKQNWFTSIDNPLEMTLTSKNPICASSLKIVGRASNAQTPIEFKLYVGMDQNNLELVGEYQDLVLDSSKSVFVTFEMKTFEFFKLVITKSNTNRYVCISELEFAIDFNGAKQYSPDSQKIKYFGDIALDYQHGTFGHSYNVKVGQIEIDFNGTQFALMFGKNCKVGISIDGGEFVEFEGDMYYSQELDKKDHKVVIRGKDFDFDSFVIR